ncbi:RNase P/RNase MRP complex subunit [Coemansia guatemalensis]|uniref:Ribonuclease P protein subunit n=1 Tax=Coemansia guatemalensis TaxID=2761395 RepID=A0A9W8I1M6_9FUNG|nr:RNase P/RNase MRP complex subunit [Coemansia guatemalensis]
MSDPAKEINLYTQLSKNAKARSGAPTDVPVDPTTRKFAEGFVSRSLASNISGAATRTAYKDRVEGRMVLLTNPFKEKLSKPGRIGESKIERKTGRKRITAKEKRELRLYEIPEEARRYELFLPLNKLWSKYMESLLGNVDADLHVAETKHQQTLLGRLIKADLHGAKMSVVRARCPNFIGISGIMAQETKNAFKFITEDDRLVVVPKTHCVFALNLPSGAQCLIYGDQFMFRASDRASRKFKPKPSVDL